MPKGENKEFKKRVGVLSDRLKKKNVVERCRAKYGTKVLDHLDVEAYITDETFSEIWESIEQDLEAVSSGFEDMSKEDLKNEIEKYREIASKHKDIEFTK